MRIYYHTTAQRDINNKNHLSYFIASRCMSSSNQDFLNINFLASFTVLSLLSGITVVTVKLEGNAIVPAM
jgi:hypothetical protein